MHWVPKRTRMSSSYQRLTLAMAFFSIVYCKHVYGQIFVYVILSANPVVYIDQSSIHTKPEIITPPPHTHTHTRIHTHSPLVTHFKYTLVELVHVRFVYPPQHSLQKLVTKRTFVCHGKKKSFSHTRT